MGQRAKPTRDNRTITVDFHDETTCVALLGNTKALVEFVLAFHLSMGLQRTPQAAAARAAAGRATPMRPVSVWALSPSGASRVRCVTPGAPSGRSVSGVPARGDRRW